VNEPLHPTDAKALIRAILRDGTVRFSEHTVLRAEERGISEVDCVNVLREGAVEPARLEKGTWRYPVSTPRVALVIAFRSEDTLVVVSTWRKT